MVHRIVVQVGVIVWAIKVFDGSSIIEVSFIAFSISSWVTFFRFCLRGFMFPLWVVFEVIKFGVFLCRLNKFKANLFSLFQKGFCPEKNDALRFVVRLPLPEFSNYS